METDEEEMGAGSSHFSTPPKKRKRLVKFNPAWKAKFNWLRDGRDEFSGKCSVCNNLIFSISHGGENDIRRHMNSKGHKLNLTASTQCNISKFFTTPNSQAEKQVIAAETAFSYHTCIHLHSYRSAGCAGSLFKTLFSDSKIASQYSCGKTKSNAIVTSVLGPFSKKIVLRNLKEGHYFSIMTDTSNKGNIKVSTCCEIF